MITSYTSDVIMVQNAPPIIMATAKSSTLPRCKNVLNLLTFVSPSDPFNCLHNLQKLQTPL